MILLTSKVFFMGLLMNYLVAIVVDRIGGVWCRAMSAERGMLMGRAIVVVVVVDVVVVVAVCCCALGAGNVGIMLMFDMAKFWFDDGGVGRSVTAPS